MKLPAVAISKSFVGIDISRFSSLASSVGALIVSAIVIVFIAWPKFTAVLNLKEENEHFGEQAQSLRSKAEQLASLNKAKLDEQLVSAEQLLPSDKKVFIMVRQLERAASENGILLNKVEVVPGVIDAGVEGAGSTVSGQGAQTQSPGAENGGIEVSKVEIKISLTSDYRSFLQFIKSLLGISRVVTIGDITLSSSGESSQVRSSLTVVAYWKFLPEQLGSIESPIQVLLQEEERILENVKSEVLAPLPETPTVPTGKVDIFSQF